MSKRKQRKCRICKKRPPWGYKDCPPGICKRCYHRHVWAERPRGRGEDAPPRRGGGSSACRFRAGSPCTPTGVASCRCDTCAACACSSRRKPIADAFSRAAGDNERVGDYSRFLSDPPVRDKRLLELSLGWTGLSGARARMAEFLRVFVITWDPLELDDARPPAFATANSDELCVYVPFWSLEGLAERRGTDVAEVLGWLGGCAVVTAAEYQRDVIAGRHARLVASGEVPDLLAGALEDESSEAVLGRLAKIEVKGGGWDEIGLGAITDTVQQAYGPVAFDRSLVELAMLPIPRQGCPRPPAFGGRDNAITVAGGCR